MWNESMDNSGENRRASPPKFGQTTGIDADQMAAERLLVGCEQGPKI
jgi:hypothetical protein